MVLDRPGLDWVAQRDHDWLSPAERARADSMRIDRRRRDFLLGRFAARRALSAWLQDPADWPLNLGDWTTSKVLEKRAASDGAPEALLDSEKIPATLSISHRAGRALCAVAGPEIALGADLERIEPRSQGFLGDFFTQAELDLVCNGKPDNRDLIANLIWSAKECAAKGLRLGLRLETRLLSVELLDGVPLHGWRPFKVRTAQCLFWGYWTPISDMVLAIAANAELATPEGLSP